MNETDPKTYNDFEINSTSTHCRIREIWQKLKQFNTK